MLNDPSETESLLPSGSTSRGGSSNRRTEQAPLLADRMPTTRRRRARDPIWSISLFSVIVFLLTWLIIFRGFHYPFQKSSEHVTLPKDPLERAKALLSAHPLIDGHIDLPVQTRFGFRNNLDEIHLDDPAFPGHVSIPKLREGKVGGFFWSAYVPCASDAHEEEGPDYTQATWRVRDTLEQIDISKLLIRKYPSTFELVTSSAGIRGAFSKGKIASLVGIEGAHQLGNSLSVLRQYYDLGVRYVTITHTCNNAFAGSSGMQGQPIEDRGISGFGARLVHEMNRLGMVVDASHTSDKTARDIFRLSRAPFIFSHSNAKGVFDVVRNVPDDLLDRIGKTAPSHRALVMATFAPQFVDSANVTLSKVADHIDYIADRVGRQHVGIGSDFDGIFDTPAGLEDVSTYPALMAELLRRGWSDRDIIGIAGENLIRTLERVEEVARGHAEITPDTTLYDRRKDL